MSTATSVISGVTLLSGVILLAGCVLTPEPSGIQELPADCTRDSGDETLRCGWGISAESRPIGLALSGGGSKSAPFAMGVLDGLRYSGVLEEIDYISSVSGGSYAALYLYSRLMAMQQEVPGAPNSVEQIFWDCIPNKRICVFAE